MSGFFGVVKFLGEEDIEILFTLATQGDSRQEARLERVS